MSFQAEASVVVRAECDTFYTFLCTDEQFMRLVKLSPSAHTIEITGRDRVSLTHDSLSYHEGNPLNDSEERCERIHFKLIEKPRYFGISVSVTVLGTQIMSTRRRLQLYESSANDGMVKIQKIRTFEACGESQTQIKESITGQTSRFLRPYVAWECRRAHSLHVSKYGELLNAK